MSAGPTVTGGSPGEDGTRALEPRVAEIVSQVLKVPRAELEPDADLRARYDVDSLQGLQIVAAIENAFDVEVPDEEMEIYGSVRTIAEKLVELGAR